MSQLTKLLPRKLGATITCILSLAITNIGFAQLPAFPGAEGFGAETTHGRGGEIIEVTNLNSSGSGSFRAACQASGPRIVVFRVSGIIDMGTNPITITNPFIYIAGQTAPGDGICLRGAPLEIKTHDVVMRFIRSRPGDDPDDFDPESRDGMWINQGSYNIVIDHCSFTWGVDENAAISYSNANDPLHDISIQWSIIAQGLNNSIHPEGLHGTGLLIADYSQDISVHHNLFAHNYQRNPLLKGGVKADVRNNIVYNWGGICVQLNDGGGTEQPTYANLVNNYFKIGADSDNWEIRINRSGDEAIATGSEIYVSGNIGPHRQSQSENEWDVVQDSDSGIRAETATSAPQVMLFEATKVVDYVLADAGAVRPERDYVDANIVSQFRDGTGQIIDGVSEAGGYPDYQLEAPPADDDHDGMADAWETEQGLDPDDPADRNDDMDGDGYTNVEEYLNTLAANANFLLRPVEVEIQNTEAHSIDITWRDVSRGESEFVLKRATHTDGAYDGAGQVNENMTQFTDTGLESETTYYYRIYAQRENIVSDSVEISASTVITGITDGQPHQYKLSVENYPNPFNPVTTIAYTIPEKTAVTLDVYSLAGERVAKLVHSARNPGRHTQTFDGRRLGSGVYLYQLKAGGQVRTGKMLLIK